MPKYIVNAFAQGGDKTAVPDAAQVDGSVSYDTGFGFDYERDPDPLVDPLTKDIPRNQTNQIFFDITENIKFWQDNTAPQWSSIRAVVGYARNARVSHGGVLYVSSVNANTTTPGSSATWVLGSDTDPTLLTIAALTPTINQLIYFIGTDTAATTAITSFGRAIIAAADAAAGRSAIGVFSATDSAEGLARQATDAEVNAGDNINAFAKPSQLRLGFNTNLSSPNGHIAFPSWLGGLVINWGKVGISYGSSQTPAMSYDPPNGLLFAQCGLGESTIGFYDAPVAPYCYISGGTLVIVNPDDADYVIATWFTIGY